MTTTDTHGDSKVITLVGTMAVKPEHEQDFLALATSTARQVLVHEPGAVVYAMHAHPTEEHTFVWVERFRDAEALEAHGNAPYVQDAMAKLPALLARPPEIMQLQQLIPE